MEKRILCKWEAKESWSSNLHTRQIRPKIKITRDKEGHSIMIKGSIQEEDITIVNIYALNISEVKLLSRVRLCATLWTAAHQAPPSIGFCRQEYWSGLPFPSPCWVHRYLQLYVFFLGWSLDYYVVSFLISCNILYFKVYSVWYEDCYSSFLLLPICIEYIFPSSHFQFLCVFRSEVGFL